MKLFPLIIVLTIVLIISTIVYFNFNTPKVVGQQEDLEKIITIAMEKAYFEGQKDMLEGKVKIIKNDSCYHWINSPWDNNQTPVFNPSEDCSK